MNGENIMCLEWWMGKFTHPYFSSVWDFHSHLERENFKNVKKCWTVIRKSGKYSKKFWTLATRGAIDQWHPWCHQGCHWTMAPLVMSPGVPLINGTPGGVRDWNFPPPGEHTNFSLSTWEWANPGLERNRDGIFPYEWRSHEYGNRKFLMSHEWHIPNSPRMA